MGAKGDCYNACVYLLKKHEGHKVKRFIKTTDTKDDLFMSLPFRDKKDALLSYCKEQLESGVKFVEVRSLSKKFHASEASIRKFLTEERIPHSRRTYYLFQPSPLLGGAYDKKTTTLHSVESRENSCALRS
jgi:hypothetical protein